MPLVTIAMPIYNAAKTLRCAMRSIVYQSFTDWQLHVIDDGSSDDSHAIAVSFNDPRVLVVKDGRHLGLAARLNQSLDMCESKYYARMDADDIAYPQRLEKQLLFSEENPGVDLIGTWMLVFGEGGAVHGKRTGTIRAGYRYSAWSTIPLPHPSFFGHLEWFKRNYYTATPLKSQDQRLLIRTYRSSHFAVLPEILLGYREEKLTYAKQFRSRASYFQSAPELVRDLGAACTATTLGVQAAKLGLDCFAILTHLDYRILRSRAIPVTAKECTEWQKIWALMNGAA